jgi:hypothetical protein
MRLDKTPQRIALEEARLAFLKWGYEKNGSTPFDKYEGWVVDYPFWNSFYLALAAFLEKKKSQRWTKTEKELVDSAVNLDVHKCLFKFCNEEEFCTLIYQKFPADSLRSALLSNVSRVIKSKDLQEQLYLHVLETDVPYNRELAFRYLAILRWDGTEEYARILWKKNDSTVKTTVIMALRSYESKLLPEFLEELMSSDDECVVSYAASVKTQLQHEKEHGCGKRRQDTR